MQSLDAVQDSGCLEQLQAAGLILDRGGFLRRPEWVRLRACARPPQNPSAEPGEWQHGWQYHVSSPLEHHFRETVILAQSCASDQAHLRSHAGPCASDVFCVAPTQKEFEMEPHHFRSLVLERFRLPLDVTDAVCACGCRLDKEGRHRAACARSGRLRTRAVGPERTLARICREAGALVRCNTKLRDMNVAVPAAEARAIEVLASGLPLFQGAQLAVDVTVRSALTANGLACVGAATTDGIVLARARRDKERKYHELLAGDPGIVVDMTVGDSDEDAPVTPSFEAPLPSWADEVEQGEQPHQVRRGRLRSQFGGITSDEEFREEEVARNTERDSSGSETDSVEWSVQGDSEDTMSLPEVESDVPPFRAPQLRGAFATMDHINVSSIFRHRASVMKSVPIFLQGFFPKCIEVGHGGGPRQSGSSETTERVERVHDVAENALAQSPRWRSEIKGQIDGTV